jgi:hypothetical protein
MPNAHVSWCSTLDKAWDMRSDLLADSIALEFSYQGNLISLAVGEDMIPEVMDVLARAHEHFRKLNERPTLEPQPA